MFTRRTLWTPWIAASLITLNFTALASAQAGAGKIGVIDIAKVFGEYQMTADLETAFDAEQKKVADQRDTRRKDLETRRKALDAFVPGTPDHKSRYDELVRAEVEFQVWLGVQERLLKDEHMRRLLQIYDDVRSAVKQVAESRGLEIVLTYDQLAADAPDSVALRQQILLQKLIYFSPQTDITPDVLTAVNDAYTKRGGASSIKIGQANTTPVTGEPAPALAAAPPQS